jgi:outer membrane phospholipase A
MGKATCVGMSKLLVCFLFIFSLDTFANQIAGPPSDETTVATSHTMAEKEKILTRQEILKILYYKPMYFAYGNPSSKVQLSFRVPLFEDIPLNFAYSQIIFWELSADSKPFLDATYNPEFFYRMNLKTEWLPVLDLGLWEHNSNGKGGDDSRSYNQSYLRSVWAFDSKNWITAFYLKVRYLYDLDEGNLDITDYVGPFEMGFKFVQRFDSWIDHLDVMLNINPGGKWGTDWEKGGYQISLDFHLGGVKVVPAFYLQYYRGYSETLINYNQQVDSFRGGVMF